MRRDPELEGMEGRKQCVCVEIVKIARIRGAMHA